MFDFQLTQRGDILLISNETVSSFKLSFNISKYSGQKISFLTVMQDKPKPKHQQSVSFYFQEPPKRIMSDLNIRDDKEKMQAARIELKTELKNVYNYEAGSEFYALNHTIYKNKNSLEPLQDAIKEIMDKYFPNCTIKLEFKAGDGFFWCQTIMASVYDSNNKFLDRFEV